MKSFKTTIYLNRSKEDNWEVMREFEETFGAECRDLAYIGYEVGVDIEVFEDGSWKVLAIDGKDVSNLGIDI
ncbi:MAG: hypothetical protein ACRDD7_15570 [Peptostreptococcaceae bacterium]